MPAFMFEVGKTYTTKQGDEVTVLGRTDLKGYECLECSDGRYRYDRSTHNEDAGRCTGTDHAYTNRHNFKRSDKPSCYYAEDGTLLNADGTRSIFDDVDQ